MRKSLTLFFIGLNFSCLFINAKHDNSVDSLIKSFENSSVDSVRMKLAASIGQKLLDSDALTSMSYLQQAYNFMEQGAVYSSPDLPMSWFRCRLLNLISSASYRLGDVQKGLSYRLQLLDEAKKSGYKDMEQIALGNLSSDHESQGNYTEALKYQSMSLQLALESGEPYTIGLALGNIGSVYGVMGQHDSALQYYSRSIPYLLKIESSKSAKFGALGWMMNNLGDIYYNAGNIDTAYYYYHLSRQYREEIDHRLGKVIVYADLAKTMRKRNNIDSAFFYVNKSIKAGEENGFLDNLEYSYKLRSELQYDKGNYKNALEDYKKSIRIRDSIFNQENAKEMLRQSMQYEHRLSRVSDSISYVQKEAILTEKTEKQRIGLIAAAGCLILIVALAYSIHKGKKRSDELLLNILPQETAEELKQKGHADAKLINEATVLFTDFKGFTAFAEKLSPNDLVKDLNECFSTFDHIVERYGLEKIKTIGDSYMAAGGLPTPNESHASDTIKAAIEMRDYIETVKTKNVSENRRYFEVRLGIHTGPVVAGIVGIKKFQYDIWGDTVNIASRMESSGMSGKINVSEKTYSLTKDLFRFEARGEIEAKGKGKIRMYFVER